jgi:hypothetical protein
MAKPVDEEVVGYRVEANITDAVKKMTKFDRDMKRHFRSVASAAKKMSKDAVSAAEDIEDANKTLLDSIGDLESATESLSALEKKQIQLQDRRNSAKGEEAEIIDQQVKSVGNLIRKNKDLVKSLTKQSKKWEFTKTLEDPKAAKALGKTVKKEMVRSLKGSFQSFMAKDAKGLVGSLGDLLKGGIKVGALGAHAKGGKMAARGSALKAAGGAKGGMMGGAMKAAGGAIGGIGKALQGFAKAAPLIGAVAGILIKLVTMFIDAQAQAKAFNKEVLQSASTVEIWGQAQGNANLASMELEDTLDGIRNAAFSAKTNLDWGITNETHQQVLSTLTQEGVSLQMMARDAKTSGKSMEEFGAQITTVSVAYSRLLGVPITEISQLQSEMVRDMGMGIEETRLAFATMAKEATESGMAANKFFAILRGVSADLSLFNLRIAEAAKFLKQVGKVMSARSAQEFLNTIKNYYKGMDLQGRIKATMLAGQGTTKDILQKDITRKQTGLAADVEKKAGPGAGKDLAAAMKAGPKATARFLAKHGDKLEAGMKESILDAQRMQAKVSRGGVVDLASALKDIDPMGVVEHTDAISWKMFGKPMEDLKDVEMLAFTQMTGMTDAQLDANAKFKAGMDVTREEISARIAEGKMTEGDKAILAGLGITGSDAEKAEKLAATSTKKIWENMSKEDREAMTETAKTMEDYAKQQGDLTQSLIDKLGVLVDFVMNQMYNIFIDIWDGIMSIPGIGKSGEEKFVAKQVYQSKDPEMIKLWGEAGGDLKKFTETMRTKGGIDTGLKKALGQYFTGETDAAKEDAKAQLNAVKDQLSIGLKHSDTSWGKAFGMTDEKGAGLAKSSVVKAGLGEEKGEEISKLMEEGMSFGDALNKAGLTIQDQVKVMDNAMTEVPPMMLQGIRDSMKRGGFITTDKPGAPGAAPGAAPAAPGEAPVAPSPQAAASDKAAAPGTSAPAAPAAATPGPIAAGVSAAPAALAVGQTPPLPREVTEFQDAQLDKLGYLGDRNDDIIKVLKRKVKLDKTFVTGELGPMVEDSVLAAVRVALVEYKLYKDVDMADFAAKVQEEGFDPKTHGKKLMEDVKGKKIHWEKGEGEGAVGGKWALGEAGAAPATDGKPKAAGGYIVGQMPDGTAKVLRPPAGEMPTYIGKGETIVPKGGGGGGGSITVNVNGIGGADLAAVIRAKVADGIVEYKRREGLG